MGEDLAKTSSSADTPPSPDGKASLAAIDEAKVLAMGEVIKALPELVRQMIAPVMEQIGSILQRNAEAIERTAATTQLMSQRISDLEKQVRLKTPLSRAQERYIGDAIRARARELLSAKDIDDKKAASKLAGMIRKSVLSRYGVTSLREAPAYDYDVALEQVKGWNDLMAVRDVAREARERAETNDV